MNYKEIVTEYHNQARQTLLGDIVQGSIVILLCFIVAIIVFKKAVELWEKDTINWERRLRKYNKQRNNYKTTKLEFFYAVQFNNKFVKEVSILDNKYGFSKELMDDYTFDKKTAERISKEFGGNIIEVCKETRINNRIVFNPESQDSNVNTLVICPSGTGKR